MSNNASTIVDTYVDAKGAQKIDIPSELREKIKNAELQVSTTAQHNNTCICSLSLQDLHVFDEARALIVKKVEEEIKYLKEHTLQLK